LLLFFPKKEDFFFEKMKQKTFSHFAPETKP